MPRESDLGHARQSLSRGSLSGDFLGKFSAIVRPRRKSHAADNNAGDVCIPILDYSDPERESNHSDGEGTTPSSSSANKTFGFMRRFSRAATHFSPTEDNGGAFLRRMMDCDEPERQRRFDIAVMSFGSLHEHLQPTNVPEATYGGDEADDNQVEEELQRWMEDSGGDQEDERKRMRRKSRMPTIGVDEDAVDEDDDNGILLLRLNHAASHATAAEDNEQEQINGSDNDDDDDDDDDDANDEESRRHDDDDAELNFDSAHLGESVRTLVRQIENASFYETRRETAVVSGASGVSNQDEEEGHAFYYKEDDRNTENLDAYAARYSDPLASDLAPRRTTYPLDTMTTTNNTSLRVPLPPPSPVPFMDQSCFIPMDEVQQDLTKSVRRLVIGLKQDADAQAQSGSAQPFVRRRGSSCPAPYTGQTSLPTKLSAPEAMAPKHEATDIDMDMELSEPPRWRKRSTLARLAPKFLDTFRFRKRTSYLYTDDELESIEGARWKIVELAFRFGGKHRAYLVQAVNMFFPLIKYGRHGGPHATRLHCNRCGTLQWQHKRGRLSDAVDLADVLQILDGRQTAVFRKYGSCPDLDARSLSLVFRDRTLDLETQSAGHRDWLLSALRTLVAYAKRQRQAEHRALAERALLPLDDMSEGSASNNSPTGGSNVGSKHAMRW